MSNVTQFPVVPRLNVIEGKKDDAGAVVRKRVRNMATNIQIAMNTVAARAVELGSAEAQEVERQLHTFHNSAMALEALVAGFTDGNGPPTKGRAA